VLLRGGSDDYGGHATTRLRLSGAGCRCDRMRKVDLAEAPTRAGARTAVRAIRGVPRCDRRSDMASVHAALLFPDVECVCWCRANQGRRRPARIDFETLSWKSETTGALSRTEAGLSIGSAQSWRGEGCSIP